MKILASEIRPGNIIEHKNSIKEFKSKDELLKVKGLGSKAYEQCVGFLRIKNGKSIVLKILTLKPLNS